MRQRAFTSLFCMAAALSGTAVAFTPAAPDAIIGEIDGVVRQHFYAPGQLGSLGWDSAVAKARKALIESSDESAIDTLLATLGTSHTAFYSRNDPAYWQMASIFEPVLARTCVAGVKPLSPVTDNEIGVFWKHIGSAWFVAGLYAGGPADAAGIEVGDEIVNVNGRPFSPVSAFIEADTPVRLAVRHHQNDAVQTIMVTPKSVRPHEALKQATEASWRIVTKGSKRIAYLHVWSWTSIEIQQVVVQAITKFNQAGVDGFVLDLRDGWGGASPNYLTIFNRDVPVLTSIDRDHQKKTYDAQIRVPAVILINGGTRSGKEVVAYGAKKYGLAKLVGEPTAGAVMFGQPFCLSEGLLYLAVSDADVDGERLEGNGVKPDVAVPFDVRYAAGSDPQLDRALQLLSGQ